MTNDPGIEILETLPSRLPDIPKKWAERAPNQTAVVETRGAWTYAEMAAAIAEAEELLRAREIRCGDRVMIVADNCRAFVTLAFGVLGVGGWVVPVNARLSGREIDEIHDHCGARCIFYTTGASVNARQHAKRHKASTSELAGGDPIGIGRVNAQCEPESKCDDETSDVAALIYTSGTTGRPKGVMLTHRNILFAAAVAARVRRLSCNDRVYGVLPMSHVVGFSVVLMATMLSGASLYLAPYFDPVATLAALEKYEVTVMAGVPSMYALLMEHATAKGIQKLDYQALRYISVSGAPLHIGLKKGIERLFGTTLHHAYGVSEMSPNVAQTRIDAPRSDTSVGPPSPGVKVRLIGKDGKTVPEGEVGEVHTYGPNMTKGYYREPSETAAAFDSEGWLNTGDLARFEGENLYIVGRSSELIVRFGFNVYPAEVEGVLNRHRAVARSAVMGRTENSRGGEEEVIAFVELLPGMAATAEEIAKFASDQLAAYKQPTRIIIVEAMPQTATGKIVKKELAKMISNDLS